MRMLMKKAPNPTHPGTFSPFKQGLKRLPNKGSLKTVLSKIGVAGGGIDDCAYIEREVDCGKDKKWKLTSATSLLVSEQKVKANWKN